MSTRPTSLFWDSLLPSSTVKQSNLPLASEETMISVASKVPVASNSFEALQADSVISIIAGK